jgi:hypothetical protein
MNVKKIAVRRAFLLKKIAHQRTELKELSQSLAPLAKVYDRATNIARSIRQHPKLILGTTLILLFLSRKYLRFGQIGLATITAAKWWISLKNR